MFYRIHAFIVSILIFGPISGLIFGPIGGLILGLMGLSYELSDGLRAWLTGELLYWLTSGLIFGLIGGLISISSKKILPLEQLSWSWQRVRSKLLRELFTGISIFFVGGLIIGLIFWLIDGGIFLRVIDVLIFGLFGGLVFGLGSGLVSVEIGHRTVPNQGIRTSLKNGLIIGLILGLFGGLVLEAGDELRVGLTLGLCFGLFSGLKYGGAACIQHFSLRQVLYSKGRIPWNYAKFIDFASGRLLMKKIGGGYVFFHRMLLEHFANMHHTKQI